MSQPSGSARAELEALCSRGLDWALHPSRSAAAMPHARRAAVLVLFGVLDSVPASTTAALSLEPAARDLDVLLQRRSATMGHHPGQVAFPGGGADASDADPAATAVREAVEETGLDPTGVDVLGMLPALPLPVSNNLVTPVPAWWTRTSVIAAVDPRESVEVFRMPVADLLDPANRASVAHPVGGGILRTPAFTVDGVLVWGFTAIVLSRMFDELGWAEPWDGARTVQP